MELSRRNFLKDIFATAATVALAGPLALVEPIHGAHELTPQERDVVADVLGLRGQVWQIEKPWRLQVTVDARRLQTLRAGPTRLLIREDDTQPWTEVGTNVVDGGYFVFSEEVRRQFDGVLARLPPLTFTLYGEWRWTLEYRQGYRQELKSRFDRGRSDAVAS